MCLNKYFMFLCLSTLLVGSSLTAVEMTPLEKKQDEAGVSGLYADIARLSNVLNSSSNFWYFSIKGYPKLENRLNSYFIADISLDQKNIILKVTLYITFRDCKGIYERECLSLELHDLVMKACREFITENITTDDVEIVVKHLGTREEKGNILFIWKGDEVRYFPIFFDDCLNSDLDLI